MATSVLDLFTIGIGPSSSHTVGPMRAGARFAESLERLDLLPSVASVVVDLYGSLALTGKGHGTDRAVLMGLEGDTPEAIDPTGVEDRVVAIERDRRLRLPGREPITFDPRVHLVFRKRERLPSHPNGMIFTAFDAAGETLRRRTFYSVGGGFVVDGDAADSTEGETRIVEDRTPQPRAFRTGAELLARCREHGASIAEIVLRNETVWRPEAETEAQLRRVAAAMRDCIEAGCRHEGILPGGLEVKRRAPGIHRQLSGPGRIHENDTLEVLDWVGLFAIAVNEENAAGGRVVTAPTNGAAGIMPAVLEYYRRFVRGATEEGCVTFLLTAGAIALLYKENASISGAEVGCQGEVGVACSMAAGALAAVLGGTPEQVECAAEIGMEHNLGLTCDPVGGLVQIPCIERNAMGAIKAIKAARLAMRGDGDQKVSLDKVIKTMRQTGADMKVKYKETSRGGLAVNVIEC